MALDFTDCIKRITQVSKKAFTPAEAQEIVDAVRARIDPENMRGSDIESVLQDVAGRMQREENLVAKIRRRNAMLTVRAVRRQRKKIARFDTPGEGLMGAMEGTAKDITGGRDSTNTKKNRLLDQFYGTLLSRLSKGGVLDVFKRGLVDEEVYLEIMDGFGSSGNKDAQNIAEVWMEIQKDLVKMQNRHGAFIHFLPDHVMRQTHDKIKLIRHYTPEEFKVGTKEGNEAAFKAWAVEIIPMLDDLRTFEGKNKDKFLRGVWKGITTDQHSTTPRLGDAAEINQTYSGTGSLAKSVSERRLLHFKDGKSAFEYNKNFGTNTLREGITIELRKAAGTIGLMQDWGPNPRQTFLDLVEDLKNETAEELGGPSPELDSLQQGSFTKVIDTIDGSIDIPENITAHRVHAGWNSIVTSANMGAILLAAIPDKAFFQTTMTYNGLRNMDTFIEQFRLFLPKTQAEKEFLWANGAMIDSFLAEVSTRFSAQETGTNKFLFNIQKALFKLGGMNWWNDIHTGASTRMMTIEWGRQADNAIDNLPVNMRNQMDRFDISGGEWDAIRVHKYDDVGGYTYVTPDRVEMIPSNVISDLMEARGERATGIGRARFRDELEGKFRGWLSDTKDEAVLRPGSKEKRITTLALQAGTPEGIASRLFFQFKSFPITVYTKIMKREFYGKGLYGENNAKGIMDWISRGPANFRLIQVVALTTIGGYVSLTIREALKGRKPRKLTDPDGTINWSVLRDSLLRGGGLGIYGDLIFNEYEKGYNNFLSRVSGPTFGQLPNAAALLTDIGKFPFGETDFKDLTKDSAKLLKRNIPFNNLFYTKPVIDYLLWYNIQEMLDPGSLDRLESKVEEQNSQEFFASPSEAAQRGIF